MNPVNGSRVGPVGLEPTTNGLKVRRTPYPLVSWNRVLRGRIGVFGPAKPRFVSSPAVLSPPRRLQFGLHESSRGRVTSWDSEKAESQGDSRWRKACAVW